METNGTDGKGQAWDGMGWGRIDWERKRCNRMGWSGMSNIDGIQIKRLLRLKN